MDQQQERARDYASHVTMYENFVRAVRIILAATAVILLLLAYTLL